MNSKTKKLRLHRETLRPLTPAQLEAAVGGTLAGTTITNYCQLHYHTQVCPPQTDNSFDFTCSQLVCG